MQGKYWTGQKVTLGFSVASYGKTQMNFGQPTWENVWYMENVW